MVYFGNDDYTSMGEWRRKFENEHLFEEDIIVRGRQILGNCSYRKQNALFGAVLKDIKPQVTKAKCLIM